MSTAHGDHAIDIVNEKGGVVGQKLRKDVDKANDLYHSIYIIVITPHKQLVLSTIPKQDDLPNVYAGTLGMTVATIRRRSETQEAAALRALTNEVHITQPAPTHLGDRYAVLPDGRKTYLSAYYIISEIPDTYSTKDIQGFTVLTADQLETAISTHAGTLAPTLQVIWQIYKRQLPV